MNQETPRISRRQFLKAAGATAAVLALGGSVAGCEPTGTDRRESIFDSDSLSPHFKAHDRETGNLVEAKGAPCAITTRNRKVSIELFNQNTNKMLDLDPLAVKSDHFGEHPAEKILRLKDKYKLTIPPDLESQLRDTRQRDNLCRLATFEYFPGEQASLVVSEIAEDGSVVTIIDSCPPQWNPPNGEYLTPKFFTVTPDKFDPSLLMEAGFQFDPSVYGNTVKQKIEGILRAKTSITLHSSKWRAERLRQIGVPLGDDDLMVISDDDNLTTSVKGFTFFATYDAYPEASFGRLFKVTQDGNVTQIYEGPGRLMLAMVNPNATNELLLSQEGFSDSDPIRFQSMFKKDLSDGTEAIVDFPGTSREGRPELYARDGKYIEGRGIIINRYGFRDEGSGLWHIDQDGELRHLLSWDHIKSWAAPIAQEHNKSLSPAIDLPTPIVFTAKEVKDNFTMTINVGHLTDNGGKIELTQIRRVGKCIGWNPQVRDSQHTGDGRYKVQVEVPYNFEGYLSNSPQVIYEVEMT